MQNFPRGKVFEKLGEVEYYYSAFLVYCMYTSPLISQKGEKVFFWKIRGEGIVGYNSVFLTYCINVQNLSGFFLGKLRKKFNIITLHL